MLNSQDSCYCSQENEPGSWPTLRKCREKPLQEKPRFLGYVYSEHIETLKSGLREPLFRGG